jgi:hypothetical protein
VGAQAFDPSTARKWLHLRSAAQRLEIISALGRLADRSGGHNVNVICIFGTTLALQGDTYAMSSSPVGHGVCSRCRLRMDARRPVVCSRKHSNVLLCFRLQTTLRVAARLEGISGVLWAARSYVYKVRVSEAQSSFLPAYSQRVCDHGRRMSIRCEQRVSRCLTYTPFDACVVARPPG